MSGDKSLREVSARHAASDLPFHGYEIHIGQSDGPDRARPFAFIGDTPEGAVSADGRVAGSYLHGMFSDDGFRTGWLSRLGVAPSGNAYEATIEQTLDALADHLETHLDVEGLLELAR